MAEKRKLKKKVKKKTHDQIMQEIERMNKRQDRGGDMLLMIDKAFDEIEAIKEQIASLQKRI